MAGFYPSIDVDQSKQGKEEVARTSSLIAASGEARSEPERIQPLTCCQQEEEMENAEQSTPISSHHVSNLDKGTGQDGEHRTDWAGLAHTHTSSSLRL